MAIRINLKKAERRLLEDGEYITRIDKVEVRPQSQRTLAPTLHVEVVTEDNGDETIDGVRLYRDMSFSDQSQWSIKEFIESVTGVLEGDDDGDVEIDEEELIGQMVGVAVYIDDQYDPRRPSNKIDAWMSVDDVGAEDDGEDTGEEADGPEVEDPDLVPA